MYIQSDLKRNEKAFKKKIHHFENRHHLLTVLPNSTLRNIS